ncbi:MAG TPA: bifunctional riboflavin kinase/FAD synthetase [Anaerolineales bacterium]|nr:bifunctional riboflavin kinase/FAD synthetase [Anaerolineales bacterium]
MIHARSLADLKPDRPALLTIGSFDGVHLGHQTLIRELVASARAQNYRAAVVTFFPHPSIVLRGRKPSFYLTTPEEKAGLFRTFGVDVLVTHPFSREISMITASDFVAQLKRALDFQELRCGADFAFGHDREGTVGWLRAHGITVKVVDPVIASGDLISSSRIRRAVAEGDIAQAAECLGRPFHVAGMVIEGNKRGRTIGIPTANLDIWDERAYPARGVYACRAWVADSPVDAVANIGVRPTFGSDDRPTVEAHLFDFTGDLYGQTLRLDFVARLRAEQKFNGVDELIAQIHRDIEQARHLLKSQLPISKTPTAS